MEHFGFLYDGCGYEINRAQWITKPGDCYKNEKACPMGYVNEKGKWKCLTTLIGHCCKHVVKGSNNEKAQYKEVMSKLEKDGRIPENIQRETDVVIRNYEEMSLGILREPSSVSITGERGYIRIVCDGSGILEGLSDFMSFESSWRKEYDSHLLIKQEDSDKQLGIVSSYFNMSSGDIYVMYRLVYQRYFEKKKRGRNVSPAIIRNDDLNSNMLPVIDIAFDQARLFYRDKKDENYEFGAMFYFFWAKYVQTDFLRNMYLEMIPLVAKYRKPGRLVWEDPPGSKLSDTRKIIKKYEHVYSARTMMEYIKIIAGPEFKPDMHIWQGNGEALPYFTDILFPGAFCKEKQRTQFELVIQRKLLERFVKVFEENFTIDNLKKFADFISENEKEDGTVGSVADHASYTMANYLTVYCVTLYVFCHKCYEVYKGDISSDGRGFILDQIQKWKDCREKCLGVLSGALFCEWLRIFNDFFQTEKRLAKIEKLLI